MRPQARIILALGAIILAGLVAYLLMPRTPKPTTPPDVPPQEPGTTTLPTTEPTTAPDMGDPFVGMPPATTSTATTAESFESRALGTRAPGGDRWDDAFNSGRLTPTPPPQTPRGATPRTYTVQSGDSLYVISQKVYGNTRQVEAIKRANPGVNPSRLRVGQVLKMPEAAATPAPTPAASDRRSSTTAPSLGAARTYRVLPGDNLRKISVRFYGNTTMWRKIYDLNRGVIGSSPDNLRAGTELRLPEGASSGR